MISLRFIDMSEIEKQLLAIQVGHCITVNEVRVRRVYQDTWLMKVNGSPKRLSLSETTYELKLLHAKKAA